MAGLAGLEQLINGAHWNDPNSGYGAWVSPLSTVRGVVPFPLSPFRTEQEESAKVRARLCSPLALGGYQGHHRHDTRGTNTELQVPL